VHDLGAGLRFRSPARRRGTQIRVRALACALLQLMLLAIYPFATLAARAAGVRATRRHGARLQRTRRPRRGFGAELLFAAIEREVIAVSARRIATSMSGTSGQRRTS
jgi:hypothetical protein